MPSAINEERILSKLKIAQTPALFAAASVFLTKSTSFIPIWRGDLRRDREIRHIDDNTLHIVQSDRNSPSHEYAAEQYFGKLRHAGTPDQLQPLTQFNPPIKISQKIKKFAKGDLNIYGRSYLQLVEHDLIKKQPAPLWWSRVIRDTKVSRQAFAAYRRKWRFAAR
ncbi:MAG: hypothetical protein ACYS1A_17090 [Planctomycetota bacterium]|jgi:hypothetical protein